MSEPGDLSKALATLRRGPVEAGYTAFRVLRDRRGRGVGRGELDEGDRLALSGLYDLDPRELRAHRELVDAQLARGASDIRSVMWFVPHFSNPHGGGIRTALRFAEHAARRHGVTSSFCVYNAQPGHAEGLSERIAAAFPALAGTVIHTQLEGRNELAPLPPADAGIATFWTSAYPLVRYGACQAKAYLVQDFEPDFYAAGSGSALAQETYHFAIPGIVNTPRLAEIYAGYGNAAVGFTPVPDEEYAGPRAARAPGSPVRIVFYGRPSTPRNAFGLGVAALRLVKERFGDGVEIVSVGEPWDPVELGLAGVVENRGRLGSLEEVAALYRGADVGLCLMLTRHPSYQPFEYFASGVVPVCNENPDTTWLLRDGENCLLARPLASSLADRIGQLVDDPELRSRLAHAGRDTLAERSWDDECERCWAAFAGGFPQ